MVVAPFVVAPAARPWPKSHGWFESVARRPDGALMYSAPTIFGRLFAGLLPAPVVNCTMTASLAPKPPADAVSVRPGEFQSSTSTRVLENPGQEFGGPLDWP